MTLWALYINLIFVTLVSFLSINNLYNKDSSINSNIKPRRGSKLPLLIIITALTLYSGLRVSFNDTSVYIRDFSLIPRTISYLSDISFSLGDYPGFNLIQIIIKIIFGENPQVFIFITSLLIISLFVLFYHRYSFNFPLGVYLFITSGIYTFSMAAVKQALAMGLGLFACKYLFEKKWMRYIVFILISSMIHPFAILYLVLPLFNKKIWTKNTILILLISFISFLNFEFFLKTIIGFTSVFGKEYNINHFVNSAGMNTMRVLVFSVVPLMSIVFKQKINRSKNSIVYISVNASILNLALMLPGIMGGANFFGRIAYYFSPFTILALNWIVFNCFNKKARKIVLFFTVVLYFIYFSNSKSGFTYEFRHLWFN